MAVSKYDKENLSKKDQDRIAAVTAAELSVSRSWRDFADECLPPEEEPNTFI